VKVESKGREGEFKRLDEIWRETRSKSRAVNNESLKCLAFLLDRGGADANLLSVHSDCLPTLAVFLLIFVYVIEMSKPRT
jgi:hypothetical protein